MLKVGLIGYGGMGKCHFGAYEQLSDRVELTAIADVEEEKQKEIAEKTNCKVYKSAKELIENADVDFVDICLPTFLHTEYAVMAMKKGFDVFMEKPVCLNEDEAQLLLKTQQETGKKVQIGQVLRFWNEYIWLKNVIETEKYGNVVTADFYRLSELPVWSWENWYCDKEKSGSMALDLHIHDADFVRFVFGDDMKDIKASCTKDKNGMINHINVQYDYGNKLINTEATWTATHSFGFLSGYRVFFENATVIQEKGKITVYGPEKVEEINFEEDLKNNAGINIDSLGAYASEIKYFIDEILNGNGKEIAPLLEGIKSARLVWKEMELCERG